ncbi:MAG: hypothetical protein JWQ20_481 [Conexibacter sp.]|nr:hypothetical protein [Conexibacter sp.]
MQDLDLGPPIAYVVLAEGTPVYARGGGQVGVVEEVLGDFSADVFDGILIHTTPLPGDHLVARADQIGELRRRGVLLRVDRTALEPAPDRRHGAAAASGDDGPSPESPLHGWLRHTWDRLTGRR